MNRLKYIFLILLILITCNSFSQAVDKLSDSDKIDLISYILKSEKVTCVYDKFDSFDPYDSVLYYLALSPVQIQEYNCKSCIIDLKKIFKKDDLKTFQQQIGSANSIKRLSKLLSTKKIKFLADHDSTTNCNISLSISYPLLNTQKNAMVVYIDYYGGPLMSGKFVSIYVKQLGSWKKLCTILGEIS